MDHVKITKNFTLDELIYSKTAEEIGCESLPSYQEIANLCRLTNLVLQPVRRKLNRVIKVNSGWRSVIVNDEIGGSKTSAHLDGAAADVRSPGKVGIIHNDKHYTVTSNFAIFYYCLFNPHIDQVIHEYGEYGNPAWVHIGITKSPLDQPRRHCMRAVANQGYIHIYEKEILDMIKSSQSIALSL